jgi:hypothetical protein
MSRKDPRRAIAVQLPPEIWQAVRQRQTRSRGRRLMDTLRHLVQDGIRRDGAMDAMPAPGGPVRALQLPKAERRWVAEEARATGLSEAQVVCTLVTRSLMAEYPTSPLSKD